MKFMLNGGNPCSTNGRSQTCLHCVCGADDKSILRLELLNFFVEWTGMDGERVSLNHVDFDGNTAIHLAAQNNLMECVSILVANGAIISIGTLNCPCKSCRAYDLTLLMGFYSCWFLFLYSLGAKGVFFMHLKSCTCDV